MLIGSVARRHSYDERLFVQAGLAAVGSAVPGTYEPCGWIITCDITSLLTDENVLFTRDRPAQPVLRFANRTV